MDQMIITDRRRDGARLVALEAMNIAGWRKEEALRLIQEEEHLQGMARLVEMINEEIEALEALRPDKVR